MSSRSRRNTVASGPSRTGVSQQSGSTTKTPGKISQTGSVIGSMPTAWWFTVTTKSGRQSSWLWTQLRPHHHPNLSRHRPQHQRIQRRHQRTTSGTLIRLPMKTTSLDSQAVKGPMRHWCMNARWNSETGMLKRIRYDKRLCTRLSYL